VPGGRPYLGKTHHKKRTGGMAQGVPQYHKKKKKKKKGGKKKPTKIKM
jgi:hypothetical protein